MDTTGTNEHRGGLRQVFEAIKPQLNLSAEQEQKIKEIFKNFREERTEIQSSGSSDIREDMRNARHGVKEQVLALLNDEQKKMFREQLHALRN